MTELDRRSLLAGLAISAAAVSGDALAQQGQPAQPAPQQPRPSRPSSPRASGSDRPSSSALIESPLDAPPLVIPQKPKPPPSDAAWEKLRTDHPSSPPTDLLLDESPQASRPKLPKS